MRLSASVFLGLGWIGICGSDSSGQVVYIDAGPALWAWEGSIDNGQTWHRSDLQVLNPASSVRVRALASFAPVVGGYFGGASLDPYVIGIDRVGLGDSIGGIGHGVLPYFPPVVATRFDNIIKIDDERDRLPPGLGPYWATVTQASPRLQQPPDSLDNPIVAFNYTLNLDGTTGDRRVDAEFAPIPFFGPDRYIFSFRLGFQNISNVYYHQVTNAPLTLHVIPAPATSGLLVVALCAAANRRRRR